MSVSHNGKQPGKFWYFRQRTNAFFASLGKKSSAKKTARSLLADTGKGVGTVGAGVTALNFLPWIPFATWGIGIATIIGGVYFGVQAYQHGKELKGSTFMKGYIRKKEEAWLQKKQAPGLITRFKNMFKRKPKTLSPAANTAQQPAKTLDKTTVSDFNAAQAPARLTERQKKAAEARERTKQQFKNSKRPFG